MNMNELLMISIIRADVVWKILNHISVTAMLQVTMSTVWRGDELSIGQQKVNICVEQKMNMVFNPMSTTILCSITLVHPSCCSIYLPLPASRHCGFIRLGFCSCFLCACVCACVCDCILQKLLLDFILNGLSLASSRKSDSSCDELVWWSSSHFPWQMRLKSSCYVKLGLVRFWQSPVKNRTNWVLEQDPKCLW